MKTKLTLLAVFLVSMLLPISQIHAASVFSTLENGTIYEGGDAIRYQLKLSQKPTFPNTVRVNFETNGQCKVGPEGNNFNEWGQIITGSDNLELDVKAVDDNYLDSEACVITYTTRSSENALNNLSYSHSFNVVDDGDNPAVTPALITNILGPSSITEGSNFLYSFSITPSTPPVDPIRITASTESQCELISGGNTINYQEINLRSGVRDSAIFTVRATNDDIVEGLHSCNVNHTLITNDTIYSGLTADHTTVPIVDDEASYDSQAIEAEELLNRPEFGRLDLNDANNDGIEDKEQPHVTSFINTVTGQRQAVEVSSKSGSCNAVSTPQVYPEAEINREDENHHYPHGLLKFNVICAQTESTADIKIFLDDLYNFDQAQLIKFNKNNGYSPVNNYEIKEFETQNGNVSLIKYQVKDGGELDEDGEANGVIADPIGIGITEVKAESNPITELNNAEEPDNLSIWIIVITPLTLATLLVARIYFSRRKKHQKLFTDLDQNEIITGEEPTKHENKKASK